MLADLLPDILAHLARGLYSELDALVQFPVGGKLLPGAGKGGDAGIAAGFVTDKGLRDGLAVRLSLEAEGALVCIMIDNVHRGYRKFDVDPRKRRLLVV